MSRIIEIVVSPEGRTQIQTQGFSGSSCQDASRFLERALGARLSEQLTGDFYQPAASQQTIQQEGS
jgi:hypothetical protein